MTDCLEGETLELATSEPAHMPEPSGGAERAVLWHQACLGSHNPALPVQAEWPGVLVVKNPPANAGGVRDGGSFPGSGRSPGGGHALQCSCLENAMDRGAWQAIVHRVAKSQTH